MEEEQHFKSLQQNLKTNTIFLIDIWDMRMNSKNITDKFKQ